MFEEDSIIIGEWKHRNFATEMIQQHNNSMNVEYNKIGENAGIVWRALNTRKYSWEELLKVTKLNPLELACAIGWLARENKIDSSANADVIYFELYHETYF